MSTQAIGQTKCNQCRSDSVAKLNYWQYFFLLSTLPFIVAMILAFVVHPVTLLMIPIVYFINRRSSKKKTPMIICRTCKQITQGK